jgi:CMP-N,N'-diacetyllegionaminic acid synthase
MKPLVIIPARGGSKGVPKKNIKVLGGKPLIQWTIDVAREIFEDNIICVSTDNFQIKKVVENLGLSVPFIRPKNLSTDTAGTYEVLLHALNYYENLGYFPDVIILLQPTSPFRTSKQIKEALELYTSNIDMIVSVKETKSNPYFVLREENENGFLVKSKDSNNIRRQDVPKVWELNGATYVINTKSLKNNTLNKFEKVKKYEMDEISSHDIDTLYDWELAQFLEKKIK